MVKEASLEFNLKKKYDETRNYLSEEIEHNDLVSTNISRHISI